MSSTAFAAPGELTRVNPRTLRGSILRSVDNGRPKSKTSCTEDARRTGYVSAPVVPGQRDPTAGQTHKPLLMTSRARAVVYSFMSMAATGHPHAEQMRTPSTRVPAELAWSVTLITTSVISTPPTPVVSPCRTSTTVVHVGDHVLEFVGVDAVRDTRRGARRRRSPH